VNREFITYEVEEKTSAYSTGAIWFRGTLFPGDLHVVRQFCDRLLATVGCDADADPEVLVQTSDSNLNMFLHRLSTQ
jgi:hypothetical protein